MFTSVSRLSLLHNTQSHWDTLGCMFMCVCVYVLNGSTTSCQAENSTVHSIDSGLTFRIHIDAHRSKSRRCGRPHTLLWSECTHRSRLSAVVASVRFATVWAIARKSYRVFCQPCSVVSTKKYSLNYMSTYHPCLDHSSTTLSVCVRPCSAVSAKIYSLNHMST